ncbi:uncharacterized protein [Bemisia tabaci]|uniref:uncharacterized protein n=1 Tax=Bemisia tabaci TaxID=7038 RepID=UPI003B287802
MTLDDMILSVSDKMEEACSSRETGKWMSSTSSIPDQFKGNLCHRKESVSPLDDDFSLPERRVLTGHIYPFAVVLRLRVLQIVCGISALVMGTVAFIEERGGFNLGLGVPAGVTTVVAAAASIHTSRGFSGYQQPSCDPPLSRFRFLGPSIQAAIPLTLLWLTACTLNVLLLLFAVRSFIHKPELTVLASVLLTFSLMTLIAVVLLLRIDIKYDPD